MPSTSLGDPLLGTLLAGRYLITERLARGGMATVYTATDTRLTRTVAVKVMHVGLGAEFARRFDQEARAAARLCHPNVVSVFDQGTDADRSYIVMEYVAGHTLRDVISRQAPLRPLRALELIEPVLTALAAAHEAGLVHCDVKPENVLISDRGQVKVADFGLVKAVSAQTSTASAHALLGTVSYLPPELVVSGQADARSDVYSAGVVLFELLTGRKPHVGSTPVQVAYAHVHSDVPPPSSLPTAGPVPDYLDALVAAVTARDPQARPHDARVMLAQLRRVEAALREGVRGDTNLTEDLTVPLRSLTAEPFDGADLSDLDATTLVPSVPPDSAPSAKAVPPQGPPKANGRERHLRQLRVQEQQALAKSRRIRGLIALVLVLLLAVLVALGSWYATAARFTSAPALVGLSQPEATRAAGVAGLSVRFDPAFSPVIAAGRVISTTPAPGVRMVTDGEMTAVVSKGPPPIPIPSLIGTPLADAETALTHAGFTVVVDTAHSATVPVGHVISQQPAAGSGHAGDQIVLQRSLGPALTPVPKVNQMNVSAATQVLQAAGFRVIIRHVPLYLGLGYVTAIDPRPGTTVPQGCTITLSVV